MGVGGGSEAGGGTIHWHREGAAVCSIKHKQPQCTCQDKIIVGSSLTPRAALLVRPSGTIPHSGLA